MKKTVRERLITAASRALAEVQEEDQAAIKEILAMLNDDEFMRGYSLKDFRGESTCPVIKYSMTKEACWKACKDYCGWEDEESGEKAECYVAMLDMAKAWKAIDSRATE